MASTENVERHRTWGERRDREALGDQPPTAGGMTGAAGWKGDAPGQKTPGAGRAVEPRETLRRVAPPKRETSPVPNAPSSATARRSRPKAGDHPRRSLQRLVRQRAYPARKALAKARQKARRARKICGHAGPGEKARLRSRVGQTARSRGNEGHAGWKDDVPAQRMLGT